MDHQVDMGYDDPVPMIIPYGPLYKPFEKSVLRLTVAIALLMLGVSMAYWQQRFDLPFDDPSQRWWVSLVAMFVHADLGHFLSNMVLFMPFSVLLCSHYGVISFPLSGLLSGYLTHWAVLHISPPDHGVVGASGMVYGLAATWLGLFLLHGNRYSFRQRLVRVVGVFLLLLFPHQFQPQVSYLAHAVGFAFGLLFVPLIARISLKTWKIYLPQLIWRPNLAVTFSSTPNVNS